jgi:toxin ParE1/3/4
MKIVYLPSARDDLVWMRTYYTRVFPEGSARAGAHFRSAQHMLAANPEIGRTTDVATVRELQVARTPFSIIYRINRGRIEVLRVWDGRAERSVLEFE